MTRNDSASVWIRFEGRTRWHIARLWSKQTQCGKPITGEEESETYVPSQAAVCGQCWRARADS